jgi:hypothetical protein
LAISSRFGPEPWIVPPVANNFTFGRSAALAKTEKVQSTTAREIRRVQEFIECLREEQMPAADFITSSRFHRAFAEAAHRWVSWGFHMLAQNLKIDNAMKK